MNTPVIIMDFTKVYRNQFFYLRNPYQLIDCTDIEGSDCYCDSEATETISKRIADLPIRAVHFLDSGNHHYITKFWTDRIHEDFILVVADHHPDMQPPLFNDILSCGGWVRTVLDTNPFLKEVWFIGVAPEYELPREEYRICRYPEKPSPVLPVYISIDKDVLSPEVITTNWDQGTMTYNQLQTVLKEIMNRHRVLGVDICGECPTCIDNRSNRINRRLLKLFSCI
ncbi:MAG: arginase family protein [Bacteroidales bacterium]|nr:arginase family protein [Bacteroidales bacterium]MDD4499795.1 arginase family protein [Bacteroidales bacterium]